MNKTGWNLENTYITLPNSFYTKMDLNPVMAPDLVILNKSLSEYLGLDPNELEKELNILAGNEKPVGSIPISKAYAGHQFGYFNMLGDGRAILLGEQITPSGERFDIEYKGSGPTPYSRCGDGRAAFGPMLREYLISEAMHELKIPTSRSLSVVRTGQRVKREKPLVGAILVRVARSHIRVGTFQYASEFRDEEELKALADYTIDRHFKWVREHDNPYLSLLREVIFLQASLIAKWQLVGFIHGVMNTDNMLVSGETIDYGPCAFMDSYSRDTVFSSIDREGRYSYGNQPAMAEWNLERFAETLIPLIHKDRKESLNMCIEELRKFREVFEKEWLEGMRRKLGIFSEDLEDIVLIDSLLSIMETHKMDFTNTFKTLSLLDEESSLFEIEDFKTWYDKWRVRLDTQSQTIEESKRLMREHNPYIIPRNLRVEEVLDAAVSRGDLAPFMNFLEALKSPYDYTIDREEYVDPLNCDKPYKTYCGT